MKASIHLLNKKLFMYHKEMKQGTEVHVTATRSGIRYSDDIPDEVGASTVVALMSKDSAVSLIFSKVIEKTLPEETQKALAPLAKYL